MPAAREITIRDLLTHTSGLVSGGISATEAAKMPRKPTDALADYIPRLAAVPLAFQPGSRWTYSPGAGFDTLGRVVEVISGQTFDAFLRQRIFEPLGMKDTFFYPPDDRLPRVATIYQRTPEGLQKAPDQRVTPNKYFSGGGGLMSTAEDYLQFGQMLVNGGQLNGKRLLSPTTVELMSSIHVKDTFPGRPAGRSWGLSVQVISDPIAAAMRVSPGSFGWDGAFGTHFWVGSQGKDGRSADGADIQPRHGPRLRERGDAGDRRVAKAEHDCSTRSSQRSDHRSHRSFDIVSLRPWVTATTEHTEHTRVKT